MSQSTDDLHLLHGLRVRGHASVAQLADRLGLPIRVVHDDLLDGEARGWVARTSFAGDETWSLTESGKARGESLLAAELDGLNARPLVEQVYERFLPLNDDVARACSEYQLTVLGLGETTATSAVARLQQPARRLGELEEQLVSHLLRFHGYAARFAAALARAEADPDWITAMDRDSCHRTWFELHEDFIATLGLQRT